MGQPPRAASGACVESDNPQGKLVELMRDGEDGGDDGMPKSAVGDEQPDTFALAACRNKGAEEARPSRATAAGPRDLKRLVDEATIRSWGPPMLDM